MALKVHREGKALLLQTDHYSRERALPQYNNSLKESVVLFDDNSRAKWPALLEDADLTLRFPVTEPYYICTLEPLRNFRFGILKLMN